MKAGATLRLDVPTASRDKRPGIKSYKFKSDGPTDPGTSVPGQRSSSDRHHVSVQPRPVPDRTMLKPCMRPDTPCWKWMPTSPSTYGQGLARPAKSMVQSLQIPLHVHRPCHDNRWDEVKEAVYPADANLTQVTAHATALHEFVLGVLFQI